MFNIIKNVIESQRFELSDMLRKIDVIWLQGEISDEEKPQLEALAREKADPQMSMDLYEMVANLDARVSKLEGSQPSEDFPEFIPGHTYHNGDKVTYEGKHYICKAPDGVVCVWSPADYPAYWEAAA